jgi:hypothetical protein
MRAFAAPAEGSGSWKNRLKLLLVAGLYVATLLWAYASVVSPEYSYEGMTLTWPNAWVMAWLLTIALLPAAFLPYALARPSALVLWWLYISTYVPAILIPAFTLTMPFEKLLPLQLTLLLCVGLLCVASSGRKLLSVSQVVISPTLFWPAFLTVWGIALAYVIISGHPGSLISNVTSLFHGSNEYDIRAKYRDVNIEAGIVLGYVVGQLSQAFDTFLISFGLIYRRRMCLLAGIIGQIVVFSLTGFKAALMSVFLLVFVAMFLKRWRSNFGMAFTLGLAALVLCCTVVDRATDGLFFSALITRRALLTPGLLTGYYFEHYSQVPFAGIGFHFHLVKDPSVLLPANEVGFAYYGHLDTSANANLWAEGFAELGMLGVVGFTLFAAFLLWIYDSISARRDVFMATLLVAMPAVTLSNTLPTTVLITHGALMATLVLYLSPPAQAGAATGMVLEREESHRLSVIGTTS